jgi:hypothetical protein
MLDYEHIGFTLITELGVWLHYNSLYIRSQRLHTLKVESGDHTEQVGVAVTLCV